MTSTQDLGKHGEVRVYRDAEQVARAAAELFVETAAESIEARGRFRVALSGGSTPRRVYELLATPAFSSHVDWDSVDIFWGDERYVPAEDRDSNYGMTFEAFLRHVPVSAHRVPTQISPPSAAAAAYEEQIWQAFEDPSMPQFDLIYLGLGANGHTASLFPYSPALRERSHLVVADFVAEVNGWRITMSAPLLNRGRTVAFLVEGQEKAPVLRDVLLGPPDPERLPAQLIAPEGKLLWIVDEAAATLLQSTTQKPRVPGTAVSRAEKKRSA
ncbi:MAG TPA: 6-phosphogluconolactonase [Terriglobales bacterium]|jgi:6-phosphogluconolactonase|nr:6-phosphogluconolactonase [Terriglobales bacterium]